MQEPKEEERKSTKKKSAPEEKFDNTEETWYLSLEGPKPDEENKPVTLDDWVSLNDCDCLAH